MKQVAGLLNHWQPVECQTAISFLSLKRKTSFCLCILSCLSSKRQVSAFVFFPVSQAKDKFLPLYSFLSLKQKTSFCLCNLSCLSSKRQVSAFVFFPVSQAKDKFLPLYVSKCLSIALLVFAYSSVCIFVIPSFLRHVFIPVDSQIFTK